MKIVLTGGPCAGKTTLSQVVGRVFHREVAVVPEAASLVFSGGFPRWGEPDCQRATQRAIYSIQTQLEAAFGVHHGGKTLVLDRATIDGAAYWTERPEQFFKEMGTSLAIELARYDLVIYLESAAPSDYAVHAKMNPNRTETWEEAHALDERSRNLWTKHPHLVLVRNERSFGQKISEVLDLLRANIPALRQK